MAYTLYIGGTFVAYTLYIGGTFVAYTHYIGGQFMAYTLQAENLWHTHYSI